MRGLSRQVTSVCMLCGCGCLLEYTLEGDSITRAKRVKWDPVSEGKPCHKGLTAWKAYKKDRILYPMKRKDRKGLIRISWREALDELEDIFKSYLEHDIAFIASAETTNENCYVTQKFARVISRTNNIDNCGRVCHAPSIKALEMTYGVTASPGCASDVLKADCILLVGTNPLSNYPSCLGARLAMMKGKATIISLQTTYDMTSRSIADIFAQLEPGSELIFLNCISAELIREGYVNDDDLVKEYPEWPEIKKHLIENCHSFMVRKFCGVELSVFKKIVKAIGESKNFVASHGMGLTQQVQGTETILSLLNLVNIKKGKIITFRGKVNTQGVGDMGCDPEHYPTGYLGKETRIMYENLIGHPVPSWKGLTLIDFLIEKPVEVVYISGMNPAVSLPALERVHRNLRNSIVIYHYPYMNLTAEFADLILPMPLLIEEEGTITNGEGRIRKVNRVIRPLGESRNQLWLFKELAVRIGKEDYFRYSSPIDVLKEITTVNPAYKEISIPLLWSGKDAWRAKQELFRRLHLVKFRGEFIRRDLRYPFLLRTSRSFFHFCSGDITRRVPNLVRQEPESLLYMNPEDLKSLGISPGERVWVISEEGKLELKAKPDFTVPQGIVVARFHFEKRAINSITPLKYDQLTKTPNYKVVPVRVEKVIH